MKERPKVDPGIISGLEELRTWVLEGETEAILSNCTPQMINAYLATFGYKRIFSYSDVQKLDPENDFVALVVPHETGTRIRIVRAGSEQVEIKGDYVYALKGIKYDRTFRGEKTRPEFVVGEPEFADGDEATRAFVLDEVLTSGSEPTQEVTIKT